MSVSLNPPNSLGFNRPLTQLVKRSLTITNHNGQPVAFKVKTTAPKLYCVRPNSGRVESGESVEVAVMLQAMKEEPPLSSKCKDKFLIQSTIITPDKETLPLHDIWSASDAAEETKVHQQKLKVVYLPAEGQTLEEEDESHPNMSTLTTGESRFDTVRQHPFTNGHAPEPVPEFSHDYEEPPTNLHIPPPHVEPEPRIVPPAHHEELERAPTPGDFNMAREDSHEEQQHHQNGNIGVVNVTVHPPPSPSPPPLQVPEPQPNTEFIAKLNEAQAEIERLRALLAAVPNSPPPTEIRRRTRALSDDGSTIGETDVGTMVDHDPIHQDGVPLQVVVIIALGVFITTYLFF